MNRSQRVWPRGRIEWANDLDGENGGSPNPVDWTIGTTERGKGGGSGGGMESL